MRLLPILAILSALCSCERQKDQIEKFVFDAKQISSKEIHRYEFYNDGKIKTDHSASYMYMAGVPFDSTISKEYYQYNNKGQIVSISDLIHASSEIKMYDDLDSLIADYSINSFGDTTRLFLIDYKNGKMTRRISRILSAKFPEIVRDIKKEDFRNYDTLLFRTDLIYEGDIHTKSLSIDKNGNLTDETLFFYEGSKQAKTITYSFLGDTKYIKETTTYLANESGEPDVLTVNTRGDTIAFEKTFFQKDLRIVVNYMGEINMQDIWYYDKKGKLIGTVLLDLNEKTRTVYSYTYDDNGNLTEEAKYIERINNEH